MQWMDNPCPDEIIIFRIFGILSKILNVRWKASCIQHFKVNNLMDLELVCKLLLPSPSFCSLKRALQGLIEVLPTLVLTASIFCSFFPAWIRGKVSKQLEWTSRKGLWRPRDETLKPDPLWQKWAENVFNNSLYISLKYISEHFLQSKFEKSSITKPLGPEAYLKPWGELPPAPSWQSWLDYLKNMCSYPKL